MRLIRVAAQEPLNCPVLSSSQGRVAYLVHHEEGAPPVAQTARGFLLRHAKENGAQVMAIGLRDWASEC